MNLMNVKPDRGFYKVSITASSVTNTITVKVLSEAMLDYLEIGTGDADQTTQPKLTKYFHNADIFRFFIYSIFYIIFLYCFFFIFLMKKVTFIILNFLLKFFIIPG